MAFDSEGYDPVLAPITAKNLPKVRHMVAFLRAMPPEKFDMRHGSVAWSPCGTAACIMGWTRDVLGVDTKGAAKIFGFKDDWNPLFYPWGEDSWNTELRDGTDPYDAAPTQAADVIEHYVRTGKVDWGAA